MLKNKENKSIEFSVDESNIDDVLYNISSRNSINVSSNLNFEGSINLQVNVMERDEIMKKREFANRDAER